MTEILIEINKEYERNFKNKKTAYLYLEKLLKRYNKYYITQENNLETSDDEENLNRLQNIIDEIMKDMAKLKQNKQKYNEIRTPSLTKADKRDLKQMREEW